MGCNSSPQSFDWQGHRGGRGERPENTISAFQYALQMGMNTLEMDVVISADSAVIVSHEPFFNEDICSPISDSVNNIYQLPYDEIRQVDCGSNKHPDFPHQQNEVAIKPLLKDVLEASESYASELGRKKPFYNIEIKSRTEWDGTFHPEVSEYVDLVMQVIGTSSIDDRFSIQSFDKRTLRYLNKVYPEVDLVLLVEDESSLENHLDEMGFIPQVFSPYYKLVDEVLVGQVHKKGMKLIPWTVNEIADMEALLEMGVDGIITDYPSRVKSLR